MRTKTASFSAISFALAAVLALLLVSVIPAAAYAMDSSEAYSEFSGAELPRLFESTSSYDDCEFVMHDYGSGNDVYRVLSVGTNPLLHRLGHLYSKNNR